MPDAIIEFEEVRGEPWWMRRERKVGKHKRKLNGEEYVSPRVVLPPDYNNFIGKNFEIYTAKGTVKEEKYGRPEEKKGTMIILFFEGEVENEGENENDVEDDIEVGSEEDDFDEEF